MALGPPHALETRSRKRSSTDRPVCGGEGERTSIMARSHIMKQRMAVVSDLLSVRIRKRRKTPKRTIQPPCSTANFDDGTCGCVATDFQLFGGNTAGQNIRVGCVKSIPT